MAITPAISTHVASGATAPVMVILDALEASSFGSAAEKLSAAYRWIVIDPDGRSYVYHNPVQGILCEVAGDWTLRLQILPDGETAWLEDEATFTVAAESWDFEYHVSGDGNDSTGDGSESTPFATVKKAFDTAVAGGAAAGDRVRIRVDRHSSSWVTESAAPSWSGTGIVLCIDAYGQVPGMVVTEVDDPSDPNLKVESQTAEDENHDGDPRAKLIVPGNWLVDTGIDSTAASGLILRDVRIFESDPAWVAGRAAVDLSAASDDPAATGHNLLVVRCLFDVPEAFDIRTTDATVASGKVTGVGNIGIFHTEFVRSNGTILVAEQLHAVDTWFHDCHVKAAADGLDAESFWRFGVTGCRFLAPIQVLDARDPALTLSTTSRRIVVSDNWLEVDAATVLSIESSAEGAWVTRNYTRPREGTLSNTFATWLAFAGDGLVCCSNALRHSQAGTIVSLAVGPAETSKSAIVANNSVRMSAASGTSALVAQEADLVGLVSSLAIKNNALESTAAGTVILLHTEETALLGTVDLDHNSLDQNTAWVFDAEANDAVSLATLQATYDLEEHAVVETAPIANPTGGDWRPTAALRGAGTPLAAAKADRNGGTRHSNRWDIGSDANGVTDFWFTQHTAPSGQRVQWQVVCIPRAQALAAGLMGDTAQLEGRPNSRAHRMYETPHNHYWAVLDVIRDGDLHTLVPDTSGQTYNFEWHPAFATQPCGQDPVFDPRFLPRGSVIIGGNEQLFEQRRPENLEMLHESPVHRFYRYWSPGPRGFQIESWFLFWTNQDMGVHDRRGAIADIWMHWIWHEWNNSNSSMEITVSELRALFGHQVHDPYRQTKGVIANWNGTNTPVRWPCTGQRMYHATAPYIWGELFGRERGVTDPADEAMFVAATGNPCAAIPAESTIDGYFIGTGNLAPTPNDPSFGTVRTIGTTNDSHGMTDVRPGHTGDTSAAAMTDFMGHTHVGPVLRTRSRRLWEWRDSYVADRAPRMGNGRNQDGSPLRFADYPGWRTWDDNFSGSGGCYYHTTDTMHGKGEPRSTNGETPLWTGFLQKNVHDVQHLDIACWLGVEQLTRDPLAMSYTRDLVNIFLAGIYLSLTGANDGWLKERALGRPMLAMLHVIKVHPELTAEAMQWITRAYARFREKWRGGRSHLLTRQVRVTEALKHGDMNDQEAVNVPFESWAGLGLCMVADYIGNAQMHSEGMAILESCIVHMYALEPGTGRKWLPYVCKYKDPKNANNEEGTPYTPEERTFGASPKVVHGNYGSWHPLIAAGSMIYFRDHTTNPTHAALAQEILDNTLVNGRPRSWTNSQANHSHFCVGGPLRRP